MKLRIVSGELKGRLLKLPESASNFRPTKSAVREALGSYLFFKIKNSRVVDLCAGSGAFGIEILSRGASFSYFVELDTMRCNEIVENLSSLGVSRSRYSVENTDLRKFIAKSVEEKYDIIFCDPPYGSIAIEDIAEKCISLLNYGGSFIFEKEATDAKKERKIKNITVGKYTFKKKVYGRTEILIYEKEQKVS